ncbi:hypothetical protein D3C75_931640 [compost metagenome]
MLHGVVQQVDQRPAQLGLFDGHLGIAAHAHADLRVFENVVQVIEGGRHFLGQRGLGQGSGLAALIGTGQEQHVVDDAAQALQLLKVRLQHFEVMLGAAPAGQRHLGLADQVGQRRAQFVGNVGVEGFKAGIGLVDPLQGGVEGAGELRHFRWQVG